MLDFVDIDFVLIVVKGVELILFISLLLAGKLIKQQVACNGDISKAIKIEGTNIITATTIGSKFNQHNSTN